ncbi:MAG: hypothetical protein ACKO96_10845, partial [Flammeovirgaceae bacterium]
DRGDTEKASCVGIPQPPSHQHGLSFDVLGGWTYISSTVCLLTMSKHPLALCLITLDLHYAVQ